MTFSIPYSIVYYKVITLNGFDVNAEWKLAALLSRMHACILKLEHKFLQRVYHVLIRGSGSILPYKNFTSESASM